MSDGCGYEDVLAVIDVDSCNAIPSLVWNSIREAVSEFVAQHCSMNALVSPLAHTCHAAFRRSIPSVELNKETCLVPIIVR